MRILALMLLAVIASAQNPNTAAFPTTVATDQDLTVAKRVSSSTLSGSINSSTLTVTVGSGTQFLQYEIITIDSEEMLICSIASNTLTICTGTRGYNGTTAASHTAGVAVRGTITSHHVNQPFAEIKAMQARLRDMTPSCLDAGANDTYACSPAPSLGSYSTGQRIQFKANTANTGAATVNFNSIGARTIKKPVGGITTDLDDNDIRAGQWVTVIYDGTNMQMVSPIGNSGTSLGSLTGCIGAASGTPSARTLVAGTGMSITNTTCGGDPTFSVNTSVIESRATQQAGTTKRVASSTGSDTYTAGMTPALTAYTDGMTVEFEATVTANTGAASLNIDSVGAVNIKKCDGTTDPSNGDIAVGRQIELRYDGTVFRLPCNPATIAAGAGDADAATVQSDGYKRCNAANGTPTYTCTMTPALTSYADGMVVLFRQTGVSSASASSTLNIDGLGAKAIKWTNLALADTAIGAAGGTCAPWQNQDYRLIYNSGADAFVMQDCVSFGAGNSGTAALRTEIPLNTHTTCSLGGSAPNYTCTMSSISGGGLSQGTSIYLYSTSAVTSAFTVNVNSNGALSVKHPDGTSDPSASCPVPALTPVPVVLNADGTDTWRMVACAAAVSGSGTLASQAEAEAGTENTKFTSSLRVAQAIVAREKRRCAVTATGNTLSGAIGATSGDPCNVHFGSVIRPITSPFSFVLDGSSSGADTVRVGVLPAGTVSVLIASGATGVCTGCTASVGSAFETNAAPLWSWTVTDDDFDVGGGTRLISDTGRDIVECGTGVSCSDSGGIRTISATGSSSAIDFMDPDYWTFHYIPFLGSQSTFLSANVHCINAGGAVDGYDTLGFSDARGARWGTGSSSGNYIGCFLGASSYAPDAVTRFFDFVGDFKAFEIQHSVRFPLTTSTVQRIGFWGLDVDDDPTNFMGAIYDSAVDGNIRCIIKNGVTTTASGTTVAASTNRIVVTFYATADGTFNCKIGATVMTVSATFPTFTDGINIGGQVKTLTGASREQIHHDIKGRVAR